LLASVGVSSFILFLSRRLITERRRRRRKREGKAEREGSKGQVTAKDKGN
jgi:hypothetical protein